MNPDDFLDKEKYSCTEVKGRLSELYDSIMKMADGIYKLDGKLPTLLLAENVSIEIKKL